MGGAPVFYSTLAELEKVADPASTIWREQLVIVGNPRATEAALRSHRKALAAATDCARPSSEHSAQPKSTFG